MILPVRDWNLGRAKNIDVNVLPAVAQGGDLAGGLCSGGRVLHHLANYGGLASCHAGFTA